MDYSGYWVDGGIVAFLVLHSFLGWRRGLLWQAAGVASLGFGVMLGLALAPSLGVYIMKSVTSDPFRAKVIGFLLVFGLVGVSLRLVAAWAEVQGEKGLPKEERDKRRAKDRVLGGMFGALKGLVVAAILVATCVTFYPKSTVWKQSHLAGAMAVAGSRLLPDGAVKEIRDWTRQHVTNIQQTLDMQ